ncbi:MAG: haloalkane dehalogenase [Betaproteobacteria bacterium]|nr:haloalkane dehalogenase [Betaproteobacteria bacterium]
MRTPDDRFANLAGYAYAPHYLEWQGLRAHYVDEGKGARTFLCLHGEPTWAYLYRRMIPPFVASGARVVAPDFIGFGRSDKPGEDAFYTFDMHRRFLLEFVERLQLENITLVVQDWGGLLGLTLPMEMPGRFTRLLVMNTALGTGDALLPEGFIAWRAYVAKNPQLDCAKLMQRSCRHLTPQEAAAYEAPFPDATAKAGVRRFPQLVPDRPEAPGAALSRKARDWWKSAWQGETFMAIGAKDPVLGPPVMHALRKVIRNCPEPYLHPEGGHFLQEWGEDIAAKALAAWR